MSQYASLLNGMMDAILAANTSQADGLLKGKSDFPARAQLAVYADGYRLRLREALEHTYPALLYLLGPGAFTTLADGFITAHPSRHFNLDRYTIGFGDYVLRQSEDAFVRDLALLEAAVHDVYQAEETLPMQPDWAARQTPETLAQAQLLPRAAAKLLAFYTPADVFFTALREGRKPNRPEPGPSWLVVVRHRHQVKRLPLTQAECVLLTVLAEGRPLAQALEDARLAAYSATDNFPADLQQWLARWVNEGIVRQPS